MKNILIVDGQGGRIGRALAERLEALRGSGCPPFRLTVVGTNAVATANMMKGSPDAEGATGENAVRICARRADVIVGPIGIIAADAMLGEITPEIARAISSAGAVRVLVPMNRRTGCDNLVVGVRDVPLGELLDEAAKTAVKAAGDAREE